MPKYMLVYEIGDTPGDLEMKDFPDAGAVKAYAANSLRMKLTMSPAATASVAVGEVEGPGDGDVEWLGAYDMKRDCDPVWSPEE